MAPTSRKKKSTKYARPIGELIGDLIEPSVRRRGFANADLIANWPELVGQRFAGCTQPEEIRWPRRRQWEDEDSDQSAILVVRCDGARALFLQHEAGQLCDKINTFLGFSAIGSIRIVQKPLDPVPEPLERPQRELSGEQQAHIDALVADIDDEDLRDSVRRLGRAILSRRGT